VIVAVLDTNVLAAGFVGLTDPRSTPGELLRRWRSAGLTLVISEPIPAELTQVFSYPYFTRRRAVRVITGALECLRSGAVIQPITVEIAGLAAHPQDDRILATALSAHAPYLVTGDKPLLRLRTVRGTRLLSPRQFLDVIASSTPG
jgi:putative PIN family toxin of toxin-antitoxin system